MGRAAHLKLRSEMEQRNPEEAAKETQNKQQKIITNLHGHRRQDSASRNKTGDSSYKEIQNKTHLRDGNEITETSQLKRKCWLTPVILATQEAEIRRIEAGSQPRPVVLETLAQKKSNTK
jgi:hypothetical protein